MFDFSIDELEKIIKIMQMTKAEDFIISNACKKIRISFASSDDVIYEPLVEEPFSHQSSPDVKPENIIVKSNFVGYFIPSLKLKYNNKVFEGDLLGQVVSVGIEHDIKSPCTGIVGVNIIDKKEVVQYGTVIAEIEPGVN